MGLTAITSVLTMEVEEELVISFGSKFQTVGEYRDELQACYRRFYPDAPAFINLPDLESILDARVNQLMETHTEVFGLDGKFAGIRKELLYVPEYYYENASTIKLSLEDLKFEAGQTNPSPMPLLNVNKKDFFNTLFILANLDRQNCMPSKSADPLLEGLVLEPAKRPDFGLLSQASVDWVNGFLTLMNKSDRKSIPALLKCVSYLNLTTVLHLCSKFVAETMLKNKSTVRIREAMDIVLSPKEEADMKTVRKYCPSGWFTGENKDPFATPAPVAATPPAVPTSADLNMQNID